MRITLTFLLTALLLSPVFLCSCAGPIAAILMAVQGDDDDKHDPVTLLVPQDYATIQEAIDAAFDGDTVLVADGTYAGFGNKNLDFWGKNIILRSENGAGACIIDCENSGRGFFFHFGETNAAVVEGFTIRNGNTGTGHGGGIYCYNYSSPTIINCIITNNMTTAGGGGYGGGVYCEGSPRIIGCIITDNTGEGGGGIGCYDVHPVIINCTIANNNSRGVGGGIYAHQAGLTLNNTIIWGNSAPGSGTQIHTEDVTTNVILNYCDYANGANDVAGPGTVTPTGCITLDPQFVNAAAQDYHLQETSPCIDKGNNSYVAWSEDLDGNTRIMNGFVDIGCYEQHRTWVDVSPGGTEGVDYPSARRLHAMAYDSHRQVVVLFGGQDSGHFSDTWEWDGTSWLDVSPGGTEGVNYPDARCQHAIAFDSSREVVVLFGGESDSGYVADTWEWDGTVWAKKSPANSPSARVYHAMVYDSNHGVTMLFGGNDSSLCDDTWEWDGANWTQRTPTNDPSPLHGHFMAYDSKRDVAVLYGGYNGSTYSGNTWEWNGTNWAQELPADEPSARAYGAMAYDSACHVVCLFSGNDVDVGWCVDMWKWDGANWREEYPHNSPSARHQHAMVYDSNRRVFVLFGGATIGGERDDTWEY